ncbi:MAG TPA: AzlC family ABC transporter permease [Thermomicrobiales bacterium]|nr:AzlC family ABC transporter permease [Thermomicrobiales bacterium]
MELRQTAVHPFDLRMDHGRAVLMRDAVGADPAGAHGMRSGPGRSVSRATGQPAPGARGSGAEAAVDLTVHPREADHDGRSPFRRGVAAVAPLRLGVVPFAVALSLLARSAGLDPWQTQASSALNFAGSAQVALVTLVAGAGGWSAILVTGVLLNLRHVLYGLSLRPLVRVERPAQRWALPFLLTDEVYGVTVRAATRGEVGPAFVLGAGLGLYLPYNLATLAGSLLGGLLPDTSAWGLDVVFPLTFLALLMPLVRSRRHLLVAVVAGGAALALSPFAPGGATILLASVGAAALGAVLDGRRG